MENSKIRLSRFEKAGYAAAVFAYRFSIRLAAAFHKKARKWVDGRKSQSLAILSAEEKKSSWIWIHCCSMGEFNDGAMVIEALKKQNEYKLLLSFSSPTGYEHYCSSDVAHKCIYLPPDTAANAKALLDNIAPQMALFIRNDIWANYLFELKRRNIPTFLISFTLNKKSGFLKWPAKAFYKKCFQLFDAVFVHDAVSAQLLGEKGFSKNVIVTGNCRVDKVYAAKKERADLLPAELLRNKKLCVIAGSTTKKDSKLFLKTILESSHKNSLWIIVPHELDPEEAAAAKKLLGARMLLYSEIANHKSANDVIWIDKIGILPELYAYADLAYVGGGFNRAGIHNILEPAVWGCFVCFGPNYRGYKEAKDLLKQEGASIVRSDVDLKRLAETFRDDKEKMLMKGKQNISYVEAQKGASARVLAYLENYRIRKQS